MFVVPATPPPSPQLREAPGDRARERSLCAGIRKVMLPDEP
jgi:hypothetical protein